MPRYFLTAAFLQNVWVLNASPLSNRPFWSLSYEFWYYVLFGVAVFVEKQLVRNIILFGILALITPDILLLLPCWLTGVAAYIYRERFSLPPRRARWSFAVTVAVAVLIFALLPQLPFTQGHPGLWFSSCFLSDWIAALAIGAVIVTFDAAKFSAIPASAASIARYTSDHTFSLYLYHYPLLVFANAFLPLGHDPFRHALCATAVIVVVLLLSMVTEGRRDAWRKFFSRCFDLLAPPWNGGTRSEQTRRQKRIQKR